MTDISTLKSRYESIYGHEPCGDGALEDIERTLEIILPEDFKEISRFFSGGFLGGVSHNDIESCGNSTSILQETLRVREQTGLNKQYAVIAEPSESIILLNTKGQPSIIWCDAIEIEKMGTNEFGPPPDTWQNYRDFFAYLLDEEEQENA
ncbi:MULTISPECIES: SMI1/KNR4 family protein [unclassified Modicisalibacter]|uniref:SMI1/KNR4 family protein n=1 Tax=unclassified Modicisalibacter TaxID=2679913 RepID=UPI001CCF4D35|nr:MULTISPECIES: SMI1/KNR4 family protein [unclassified Modicisalibacter]MBZ9558062.1 SMI1/KNR4 family protein [Modicisalibacter sp. R2A 31.J]MBZ9573269.1 SMI1/KNR4 family protein [Modicisalibacter sp. MOD 31.J]